MPWVNSVDQRVIREVTELNLILAKWRNYQDLMWHFKVERGNEGTVDLHVIQMFETEKPGWYKAWLNDGRTVWLHKDGWKNGEVECKVIEGDLETLPAFCFESKQDMVEYIWLKTNIDGVKERLSHVRAMPELTSTASDRRAAAVAQREAEDEEELLVRGLFSEKEIEEHEPGLRVWSAEDTWHREHGLGNWTVQLNFYVSDGRTWKKCKDRVVIKRFQPKNGKPRCEDQCVPDGDIDTFMNELQARCRDQDWQGSRVFRNPGTWKIKGAWHRQYCGNCRQRTLHLVQPDTINCSVKGCNRRLDKYWVEVFWPMGVLPFRKAPGPVVKEWQPGISKKWAVSVMLMGEYGRQLKAQIESKKGQS